MDRRKQTVFLKNLRSNLGVWGAPEIALIGNKTGSTLLFTPVGSCEQNSGGL